VAKYLYSDLKIGEYKALHHTKKLAILRDIIFKRLAFKDEYLSVCSRILFYLLEDEKISLLTIQKKAIFRAKYFFDKSASLHQLRGTLGRLKKERLRQSNALQHKKHVNEGRNGVYVLLDSEYQKKLEMALNGSKMTLTALFTTFIDSLQPINAK
jgi:hypothetical protein